MVKHVFVDDFDPGYLDIVPGPKNRSVNFVTEEHLARLEKRGTPRPELRHIGTLPQTPVRVVMNRHLNWYRRYEIGSDKIIEEIRLEDAKIYPDASCFIGIIIPPRNTPRIVHSGLRKSAFMSRAAICEKLARLAGERMPMPVQSRDVCVILHLPKLKKPPAADFLQMIMRVQDWVQAMDAHFGREARERGLLTND